jgi:hypothetical protein
LPHCQHKAARWVIAPLPNSSWVLVSEGELVGSGDPRQISEYPTPHGDHGRGMISCILKSVFLPPEEL